MVSIGYGKGGQPLAANYNSSCRPLDDNYLFSRPLRIVTEPLENDNPRQLSGFFQLTGVSLVFKLFHVFS